MSDEQVEVQRVLDIIREENPMVLELAIRRAAVEKLRARIEELEGQP